MSFIVDLPPEVEHQLQAEANRQGLPIAAIALRFIERGIESALKNNPNDLSYSEWEERFKKLIDRPADVRIPAITPEMTRRVNIYEAEE